jgi:hypothetical protein
MGYSNHFTSMMGRAVQALVANNNSGMASPGSRATKTTIVVSFHRRVSEVDAIGRWPAEQLPFRRR